MKVFIVAAVSAFALATVCVGAEAQQVPPLRCAPVGMTLHLFNRRYPRQQM
jgi:hypothetical protein